MGGTSSLAIYTSDKHYIGKSLTPHCNADTEYRQLKNSRELYEIKFMGVCHRRMHTPCVQNQKLLDYIYTHTYIRI